MQPAMARRRRARRRCRLFICLLKVEEVFAGGGMKIFDGLGQGDAAGGKVALGNSELGEHFVDASEGLDTSPIAFAGLVVDADAEAHVFFA